MRKEPLKQTIKNWWNSLDKSTRNNIAAFFLALSISLVIVFAFILSPLILILFSFIPQKIKKRPFFNRLSMAERAIKGFPNWLFMSSVVSFLGAATVAINVDISQVDISQSQSLKRLVIDSFKIIFDNAESIAIVSAAALYFKEAPARKAQKHYEAFQVIDSAVGNRMSYARLVALEALNYDNVSLENLDLSDASLKNAHLFSANLSNSTLARSNLSSAKLEFADLNGADLNGANLEGANLEGANLEGANLKGANLSRVNFKRANLKKADFEGADLRWAKLSGANVSNATLSNSNLEKAILYKTNFEGADLEGINLASACLIKTNFQGAKNLIPQQLMGDDPPHICKAKFPDSIPASKISPDRDCNNSNFLYERLYP